MATLRELIIKISANSQSFQTEISRASRMGQDYYRTMQNGGRQAAAASRETQRALADLTGQLNSAKASAVGLAGAFAGAYATGHLISLADEWSSVNARLKQASQSTDDFNESQRALMEISQRTGTAFSDNASLFARSAASMREYGYSSEEVLKVTEAISTGLKLSGASTSEASSVITQFSQALAQGVLRGEEFNSVNENGDRVIRALASGMGVARKDLKAMADQGQLTADKVVPALISQLGALQDEYGAMPQTVASATTKIENAFLAWVGGANEATGATSALTGALNAISDNINTVASAAGVLAAIGGSRFIGGMIGDLGSQTAQLVEARKNEIALAAARASTATQSQRKAAADAIAAERAFGSRFLFTVSGYLVQVTGQHTHRLSKNPDTTENCCKPHGFLAAYPFPCIGVVSHSHCFSEFCRSSDRGVTFFEHSGEKHQSVPPRNVFPASESVRETSHDQIRQSIPALIKPPGG